MEVSEIQLHTVHNISDWKRYQLPRGCKTLPTRLLEVIQKNIDNGNNIWAYANTWYKEHIYYKGDINTTSDWIFVTNGGGYYKHGTNLCVWDTRPWIDRVKHPFAELSNNPKEVAQAEALGGDKFYLGCLWKGCRGVELAKELATDMDFSYRAKN